MLREEFACALLIVSSPVATHAEAKEHVEERDAQSRADEPVSGYSVRVSPRHAQDIDHPRSTTDLPSGAIVPPYSYYSVVLRPKRKRPVPGIFWWMTTRSMSHHGGVMALFSPDDRFVDCKAWGDARPPQCGWSGGNDIQLHPPSPPARP